MAATGPVPLIGMRRIHAGKKGTRQCGTGDGRNKGVGNKGVGNEYANGSRHFFSPTASRKPYRGYPKYQLPMWHRYRVELYPHVPGLGFGCGIRDKHGNDLEFPSAFRQSRRDGKPRGIVKIRSGGAV